MAAKLTRRQIAGYIAESLQRGVNRKHLLAEVAAYLIERKQTGTYQLVADDVALLLASEKAHLLAGATVARPIGTELEKTIKQHLQAVSGIKSVELTVDVDTGIIGGMILRTPDEVQDASIRTTLRTLQAIK